MNSILNFLDGGSGLFGRSQTQRQSSKAREPIVHSEGKDARVVLHDDPKAALARRTVMAVYGYDGVPSSAGRKPVIEVRDSSGNFVPVNQANPFGNAETQLAALSAFRDTGNIVGAGDDGRAAISSRELGESSFGFNNSNTLDLVTRAAISEQNNVSPISSDTGAPAPIDTADLSGGIEAVTPTPSAGVGSSKAEQALTTGAAGAINDLIMARRQQASLRETIGDTSAVGANSNSNVLGYVNNTASNPTGGAAGAIASITGRQNEVNGLQAGNLDGVNIIDQTRGKIRSRPVQDNVLNQLKIAAAATGDNLDVIITSGGQSRRGSGGNRTGSTRHDEGNAADVVLQLNGKPITPRSHPGVYAKFLGNSVAAGAKGVGHYPWGVHVGGGNPAAWGPNRKANSLSPLFKREIQRGRENPFTQQQLGNLTTKRQSAQQERKSPTPVPTPRPIEENLSHMFGAPSVTNAPRNSSIQRPKDIEKVANNNTSVSNVAQPPSSGYFGEATPDYYG